ncbi:hypothetical protein THAOC_18851, partial [Thalassiosira oceanica]
METAGRLFDFRNLAVRSDGTTPIKDTPPITPSIVASGLGTKHAVRCCKDNEDEDEEDWIVPPKLTSGKCLVRTLKQQWTGERGVDRKHFNPQQQIGFSKYPERKCPIKQQEGDKKGEGEALDRKENINEIVCASECRKDKRCASFNFNTSGGYCDLLSLSSCASYTDTVESDDGTTSWHFNKHFHVPNGYERYPNNQGCDASETLFSDYSGVDISPQVCANVCSERDDCASFVYDQPNKTTTRCSFYSHAVCGKLSQTFPHTSSDYVYMDWYLKKDDFQEGDTECLFLTYDDAV